MGSKTSTAIKHRWNAANYRGYQIALRRDTDAGRIEWIDAHRGDYTLMEIFRCGIDSLMGK